VERDKSKVYRSILLFSITAFILLALVTFDPYDPPNDNFPRNEPVRNSCGIVGAYLSYVLLFYFGPVAAYCLVLLGCFWGGLFIVGRKVKKGWVRGIGIAFFLVAVSALSSRTIFPFVLTKDLPSLGGIAGEALAQILARALAVPGATLVLVSVATFSLVLATDMVAVNLLFRLLGLIKKAWASYRGRRHFRKVRLTAAPAAPAVRPAWSGVGGGGSVEAPAEPEEAARETASQEAAEHQAKIVRKKERARRSRPYQPRQVTPYPLPPLDLLDEPEEIDTGSHEEMMRQRARELEKALAQFGVEARVVQIDPGPVITLYEVELAPGIKVGKIISLSDDIGMALKAAPVRIVAPLPGKGTVGVEVPNVQRRIVRVKELILAAASQIRKKHIPLLLGKDAAGNPLICDLVEMPHLLIAGCTGSGKSVCLNSIILSVLLNRTPDEVRFLLVDPKMVELSTFKDIPHLICPVLTDMKKAASVLEWAVSKMDERYNLLARAGVRNIRTYNQIPKEELLRRLELEGAAEEEKAEVPLRMPYIIIVVDELADLMMVAAKDIEAYVTRLAQKSRAVGIHIVMATQRPSVDVITGLIKSNLPCRVSFQVSSKVDSRTILDQNGAEKLLGRGDMLFIPPGSARLIRAQGTFVSDEEIKKVIAYLTEHCPQVFSRELFQLRGTSQIRPGERDELYDEAVRIILETQRGSVSLLQRRLEIGYSRAARLIDMMYEEGIVGEYKGSQAREVLFTLEEWESRRPLEEPTNEEDGR